MMFPVVYQHAAKVAPGPTPGAKALMAWCLAHYPPGTNLGIYNPRNVRGGQALSLHAEGRAIDVGYPVQRPDGHPLGQLLAADMVRHHQALGVQGVIFARSIWTNTRPTWRPYTGAADHFDHVHIELTREAAAGLTTDIIRQTLEATTVPTLPENDPGARIQRAINANGLQPPLDIDGDCGPATADGLDKVLAYLNAQIAGLRKQLATAEADANLYGEQRDTAVANREAAEAEVAQLRKQIQAGGNRAAVLDIVADLATLGDKVHEAGAKLQGLA